MSSNEIFWIKQIHRPEVEIKVGEPGPRLNLRTILPLWYKISLHRYIKAYKNKIYLRIPYNLPTNGIPSLR